MECNLKNISKRLQKVREDQDLNQTEFAKKLGVSKQTYGKIEKNKRSLQINEVTIYKNKFNINPNWLLFDEGPEKYEEDLKQNALITLILDYRQYGGEVDLVKTHIVKTILNRLFKKSFLLNFIPLSADLLQNRMLHTLIRIILSSNYSGLEKDAKNYFRDQVEIFQKKELFKEGIKKNIYVLLENINNKDCYYLLINKNITLKSLLERIPLFDRTIEEFIIKESRELYNRIRKLE